MSGPVCAFKFARTTIVDGVTMRKGAQCQSLAEPDGRFCATHTYSTARRKRKSPPPATEPAESNLLTLILALDTKVRELERRLETLESAAQAAKANQDSWFSMDGFVSSLHPQ